MNNLVKTLLASIIAIAANRVYAQTFFQGQRMPDMGTPIQVQEDLYIDHLPGQTGALAVSKVFARRWMAGIPVGFSRNGIELKGGFAHAIFDTKAYDWMPEKLSIIAGAGIFQDGQGAYQNVAPRIFGTYMAGSISLDGELVVPVHLKTGKRSTHLGAALGIPLGNRFRIGPIAAKGTDAPWQAGGRVR